jgi:hypothetical protein
MSQQASIWSRFHAAALQTHGAEAAAKKADEALAEYNKRFEVLAKYEAELAAAHELLRIRDQQVYIGLQALMTGSDLWEAFHRSGRDHSGPQAEAHWFDQMSCLVKNHLRLIGDTWTIVPHGMTETDPSLKGNNR